MTHITDRIEVLQERLNKMIVKQDDDNNELYKLSTELDTWIVRFYKEKQ